MLTIFPLGNGDTRLSLNGGGGNATFALAVALALTTISEPDTYGMLLAG